jgi:hypothetical protein
MPVPAGRHALASITFRKAGVTADLERTHAWDEQDSSRGQRPTSAKCCGCASRAGPVTASSSRRATATRAPSGEAAANVEAIGACSASPARRSASAGTARLDDRSKSSASVTRRAAPTRRRAYRRHSARLLRSRRGGDPRAGRRSARDSYRTNPVTPGLLRLATEIAPVAESGARVRAFESAWMRTQRKGACLPVSLPAAVASACCGFVDAGRGHVGRGNRSARGAAV